MNFFATKESLTNEMLLGYMNEMREYMQNMIVSDEEFLGCGLLFIGKTNQQTHGSGGTKSRVPPLYPQGSARSDRQVSKKSFHIYDKSNQDHLRSTIRYVV